MQQDNPKFVRAIADAVPALIAYWDRDLRCSFANQQYLQWFGRPLSDTVGASLREVLGEELFALALPHVRAALNGHEQSFERVLTRADGKVAYAWVRYVPDRDDADCVLGFFALTMDVTPLRLADQRARESEGLYRLLSEHSSDMIFQLDGDLVRRYASPAAREILGYSPDELIGIKPVTQIHPEDAERVAAVFRSLLDGKTDRGAVTNRIRHKDGHWVWVEVELRAVQDHGTGGRSGIVGSMRDISLRKAMEAEIAEANRRLELLARQDGLTGLHNRRSFDEMLFRFYQGARRAGEDLALVMIDVDRFKLFNDRYGHVSGDQCLRRVSQILEAEIHRPHDMAARYGGEEFALLLPNTNEDGAAVVAERIRLSVMGLDIEHGGNPEGVVTICAGVAAIGRNGDVVVSERLLHQADRALYAAKEAGRNRVEMSSNLTAVPDPAPDRTLLAEVNPGKNQRAADEFERAV